MSNEVGPDVALHKRFFRLAIVFAVLMLINGVLNISLMRSRHAKDERVANENGEIDSRIEESKNTVAATNDLLRQASELNERAAKIEAALGDSKKAGK
jgi:hypothetical protein